MDACRHHTARLHQRRFVFFFPFRLYFIYFFGRLGQQLLYQLHLLNKQTFVYLGRYVSLLGSSALLAFSLEFSEFLLVTNTSSLTLSVSGIFKVNIDIR
jgi:hypothetical protein